MAFGTWAFGHYTLTYQAPNVGSIARDVGSIQGARTLSINNEGIPITTDLFGDTVVDGIYTGRNMFLQMVLKEWNRPVIEQILNPFIGGDDLTGNDMDYVEGDAPNGENWEGTIGTVGSAYCDRAGIITMTAVTNTQAAVNSYLTFSARRAIIAPGTNPEIPFGNVEREVPITFQLLPYQITPPSSVWRQYEVTYPAP